MPPDACSTFLPPMVLTPPSTCDFSFTTTPTFYMFLQFYHATACTHTCHYFLHHHCFSSQYTTHLPLHILLPATTAYHLPHTHHITYHTHLAFFCSSTGSEKTDFFFTIHVPPLRFCPLPGTGTFYHDYYCCSASPTCSTPLDTTYSTWTPHYSAAGLVPCTFLPTYVPHHHNRHSAISLPTPHTFYHAASTCLHTPLPTLCSFPVTCLFPTAHTRSYYSPSLPPLPGLPAAMRCIVHVHYHHSHSQFCLHTLPHFLYHHYWLFAVADFSCTARFLRYFVLLHMGLNLAFLFLGLSVGGLFALCAALYAMAGWHLGGEEGEGMLVLMSIVSYYKLLALTCVSEENNVANIIHLSNYSLSLYSQRLFAFRSNVPALPARAPRCARLGRGCAAARTLLPLHAAHYALYYVYAAAYRAPRRSAARTARTRTAHCCCCAFCACCCCLPARFLTIYIPRHHFSIPAPACLLLHCLPAPAIYSILPRLAVPRALLRTLSYSTSRLLLPLLPLPVLHAFYCCLYYIPFPCCGFFAFYTYLLYRFLHATFGRFQTPAVFVPLLRLPPFGLEVSIACLVLLCAYYTTFLLYRAFPVLVHAIAAVLSAHAPLTTDKIFLQLPRFYRSLLFLLLLLRALFTCHRCVSTAVPFTPATPATPACHHACFWTSPCLLPFCAFLRSAACYILYLPGRFCATTTALLLLRRAFRYHLRTFLSPPRAARLCCLVYYAISFFVFFTAFWTGTFVLYSNFWTFTFATCLPAYHYLLLLPLHFCIFFSHALPLAHMRIYHHRAPPPYRVKTQFHLPPFPAHYLHCVLILSTGLCFDFLLRSVYTTCTAWFLPLLPFHNILPPFQLHGSTAYLPFTTHTTSSCTCYCQ